MNMNKVLKYNVTGLCSLIIITLLTFTFILPTMTVSAIPSDVKVYDYNELFTEEERDELDETLRTLSEESEVDIILITTSTLQGQSRKRYLEDFYDEMKPGYEGEYGTTTLMLLNMDPSDRGVEIQGYKDAEYAINNQVIEQILDSIYESLVDGKYVDAVVGYGEEVSRYMDAYHINGSSSSSSSHNNSGNNNYYNNNSNYNDNFNYNNPSYETDPFADMIKNPFVQLITSLVIGGVSVGVMASNAGGRRTTNSRTYLDSSKAFVPIRQDNYIRTTTTRVKKPSDNNHNSGGGGGTSSGGHSHSGGGRSF